MLISEKKARAATTTSLHTNKTRKRHQDLKMKLAPVLMISVRWSTSTLSLQLKPPAVPSILQMRWWLHAQSTGKVYKKEGKKTPKKKQTQTKEQPCNHFHNNDSALVSGITLHLASSFLFSTVRTHANRIICLMLHSLPSWAKAERAPNSHF